MPPVTTPAVIQLAFDPIVTVGGWSVRLETVALAAVILVALLVAARVARQTPLDVTRSPDDLLPPLPPEPVADGGAPEPPGPPEPNHLRRDDLLFIAVASVPGAVAGGRLGYVLLHLDFYRANPGAILDPGQGSLQLSLAVLGGTLSAAIITTLLGAPVGRWLHALAMPVLLAIAAGKAAMALGGAGQGLPADVAWATAYTGPGPWGSLAPGIASHPAQLYEALAAAAVLVLLVVTSGAGAFLRRDGRAFLVGVGLWAAARAVVAATWRDPATVGALGTDQVLSVAIAAGCLLGAGILWLRGRREPAPWRPALGLGGHGGSAAGRSGTGPEWPDPEQRPRF